MKIKMKQIKKILAANRSEIAIRIFRAAEESRNIFNYTHTYMTNRPTRRGK